MGRGVSVFVLCAAFKIGDRDVLCAFDEVAECGRGEELERFGVDAGKEATDEGGKLWGDRIVG